MTWPVRRLEELALPEKGAIKIGPFGSQLKRHELVSEGVHVVGIENVLARQFDGLGDRYVTEEKYRTLRSVEIKPGDLVITMMGTIGEVAIVPQGTSTSIMDPHLLRFRPHLELCLPEYVAWFFQSPAARGSVTGHAHGAIMKGLNAGIVNAGIVRSLPIPLPSVPEQRRLVEILDHSDRIRRLRAEADTKTDRFLPALFTKMFDEPATAWDVAPLEDLLRREKGAQSGPFGTHLHNHDFVSSGTVLAVGIDNVQDGEFVPGRNRRITSEKYDELKKYTLKQGDVLITNKGTVGRTCVYPGTPSPAICTKHVYRIQLDERVHPEYLSATLRFSPDARAQLGAGVTSQIGAGIKSADLRRLRLSIPPRKLQDDFASRKGQIDEIRQRTNRARERVEALFSNLLHRAFSGDLTASWREAHMKELVQEIDQQTKVLAAS